MVRVGGNATLIVADAANPFPPSVEVIGLVVLFFTPSLRAVTFKLKVQEALATSVASNRLALLDPAVAVMAPLPHDPLKLLGLATTSPAGRLSVKPMPLNGSLPFGFVMVKLSVVFPFGSTVAAPNVLVSVGDATTVNAVVLLTAPGPLSLELIGPVVFFWIPAATPVTFTEMVQELLDAIVAPARTMLLLPAVELIVPVHVVVKPLGVDTISPEGRVSLKETPVVRTPFGLVMEKFRLVVPFKGIATLPKDFVRVGGRLFTTIVATLDPVGGREL